ncbi:Flp family type IVb pilin [Sulfitobacter sabulilitoris]|uniref:Flp family type IVb pilin n=1 Tax=Sulfitobacter sabulilitoris TaxID=2562655 RepID=UPI001478ECED|nr:hypothetical protein [Sulfitobacter sabulilitoris]
MKTVLSRFWKDTNGAVTVDWVVLCASVVMLAVAAITSVQTGADTLAKNTGDYIVGLEF